SASGLKPQVVRAFYDGTRIYLVIALWRGTQVVALEPSTGKLLWIGPPDLSTFISNPDMAALSNGRLILITNSVAIVLDAETGSLLRQVPLMLDSLRPAEILDGTIYTNGDQVSAIDAPTAHEKWRFENPCVQRGHEVYPRLLSDNIIYVAPTCGGLYALDAFDGRVLWRYSAPGESRVEKFTLFRGLGYALTDDAKLYAIDLATGNMVGEAQFAPATTPIEVSEALVSSDQLLLLHFGGKSLFAFQ
ncbi:MAG: PQQ-like beta-propeller repeat protein, partial [Caldilineaceae bacterium]|nr:PQQ-like beta-propeller repeat protein [Caldilineaceae bacterium]